MRRNLALDLRDMGERPVPARFKLARYQTVRGVGGVVLAEGAIGRVARRFEIASKSVAYLIAPVLRAVSTRPCSRRSPAATGSSAIRIY